MYDYKIVQWNEYDLNSQVNIAFSYYMAEVHNTFPMVILQPIN